MKTNGTTAILPALYAGWMDSLLGKPVPRETRATCDNCAMCASDGPPAPDALYFSPRVKCCTYEPNLPNFLVGAVLEDDTIPSGRATLEQRIDRGVGVSPLSLASSKAYNLLYERSGPGFGRAESMVCPHYLADEGGTCGIWRHRNSVCATWFCKHDRGAVGLAFWDRLRDMLFSVERELAYWCVLESDLDESAIVALFPDERALHESQSMTAADLDKRSDPALARKLWGNYLGREREYYRACAQRVRSLSWGDVLAISGPLVAARARIARQAFETLVRRTAPERLGLGSLEVVGSYDDRVRVVSYSQLDPLDLSTGLFEILRYFDGRPTSDTCREIERDLGLRVEKDLIRKLADFKILVPREPANLEGR